MGEIVQFLERRGVDRRVIKKFMTFLIENEAYIDYVTDLTALMQGLILGLNHNNFTFKDWKDFSSKMRIPNEEIIFRTLIWEQTLHPQKWATLNAIWRHRVHEMEKNHKIYEGLF